MDPDRALRKWKRLRADFKHPSPLKRKVPIGSDECAFSIFLHRRVCDYSNYHEVVKILGEPDRTFTIESGQWVCVWYTVRRDGEYRGFMIVFPEKKEDRSADFVPRIKQVKTEDGWADFLVRYPPLGK